MGSPIVAILKSYSPTTGAVIASVLIRSDGTLELSGDHAMARFHIGKLVSQPLGARLEKPLRQCRACGHCNDSAAPACASCTSPLQRRGRPRKVFAPFSS